jgi:acyl-coenzyme A synthetase/AMP-(fatty) acid ligase
MSSTVSGNKFVRPHVNLGYGDDLPDGINTLPDLVEFAAKHNPDHVFGQQLRANDPTNPCIITFSQLASAVERAAAWLVGVGATTGRTEKDAKIPPVALLCGSDITLYIYMCALLRIGAPVRHCLIPVFFFSSILTYSIQVLQISARLTPVAILHLLKSTNPSAVLISSQVSHAIHETIKLYEQEQPEDFIYPKIVESVGYESFLRPTGAIAGYPAPPKCAKFDSSDTSAFIMHSSGTTGLPKPIGHSQLYPLLYPACHRIPEQSEPFNYQVTTLPLYHVRIYPASPAGYYSHRQF